MARPCTNAEPCLGWTPGKGGHSPVCERLVAQGARPRVAVRPPLRPAKLSPLDLDVAKGDGRIGCACGVETVPSREAELERDGQLHRYGNPCRPTKGG